MEITCYREQEIRREFRLLPAITYNLAHTLLARNANGTLFIPIRSMQYLAIMDAEELVFLDGERKCWIEIAWHKFHPQKRTALDEPVEYEAVYYSEGAEKLMSRLQAEFPRALQELAKKATVEGSASVFKFPARGKSE